MKYIIGFIEAVIFIGLMYGLYVNWKSQTICGVSIGFEGYNNLVFPTILVIFGCFAVGLFSGLLLLSILKQNYRDKIEFYARRSEKLSQQNEIEVDDKEALQRKIASLEIALEKALNSK